MRRGHQHQSVDPLWGDGREHHSSGTAVRGPKHVGGIDGDVTAVAAEDLGPCVRPGSDCTADRAVILRAAEEGIAAVSTRTFVASLREYNRAMRVRHDYGPLGREEVVHVESKTLS